MMGCKEETVAPVVAVAPLIIADRAAGSGVIGIGIDPERFLVLVLSGEKLAIDTRRASV